MSIYPLILFLSMARAAFADSEMAARFLLEKPPAEYRFDTYESIPEWYVHYNITATLIALAKDHGLASYLAKRWTVRNGGREYAFEVDPRFKWSDGTPITAKEVLENIFLRPRHRSARFLKKIIDYGNIGENAYLDGRGRIVVRLKRAHPRFLYYLTRPEFGLVDWVRLKPPYLLASRPRTSGDYRIERLGSKSIRLGKNPHGPRLSADNPDSAVFEYIKSSERVLERISAGDIDFFEIRSTDILQHADRAAYRVVNGSYDSLEALQARRVTPRQKRALSVLGRYLRRGEFIRSPRVPANSLVLNSLVKESPLKPLSREKAVRLLNGERIELTVELDSSSPKERFELAESVAAQAEEIGIFIKLKRRAANFIERWSREEYEATILNMGVHTHDEVELWSGYLCSGFRPYRIFRDIVCRDVERAGHVETLAKRKEALKLVYASMLDSGYIVPLFFQPKRYLVSRRWRLSRFNRGNPYILLRTLVEAST